MEARENGDATRRSAVAAARRASVVDLDREHAPDGASTRGVWVRARLWIEEIEASMRYRPVRTLVTGFGVGLLLGRLFK